MSTITTSSYYLLRLFFLVVVLSIHNVVVNAIKDIPLPHVDVFMLCSTDIENENSKLNYKREMDGYFTDLLPSAVDVVISTGNQNIIECPGDSERKIVKVASDGYAEFDDHNPLTEDNIKSLVKVETLKAYFKDVCVKLDTFEAIISDSGSEPKTGVEGAVTQYLCDAEKNEILERGLETGAIVGIIVSIILVFAILGCICVLCGFCA